MKNLIPNMYSKSIFDIDYDKLKESNIKLLLFDLDNTCVPFSDKEPNNKLIKLFKELEKKEFEVMIFSNSSEKRLKPFKEKLNVECHYTSLKPLKRKLIKLIKTKSYKKEEIIIIGDQLFTDILVGNRSGINTMLVDPLSNVDLKITKVWRFFEKRILNKYKEKGIIKKD